MMLSKSFALFAWLGLTAVLPVKADEIRVVVGGIGIIRYTPSSVVSRLYLISSCAAKQTFVA
jgi:hypothetical protein